MLLRGLLSGLGLLCCLGGGLGSLRDKLAYRLGRELEQRDLPKHALSVYARGESLRCVERQVRLLFDKGLAAAEPLYPKVATVIESSSDRESYNWLGSVPGINTKHQPALSAMYGRQAVIREIYGATEGMFGQQLDEKRAWVPNYDMFFFEVQAGSKVKQMHEMRSGDRGSLIVSTPILPRYRIGDTILASQPPYFRCIGREEWWTPLRYAWDELTSLNLGQL